MYFGLNFAVVPRQNVFFSKSNDEWLKSQVEGNEYTIKSALVNDLIRQARNQQRQIDWIRSKLESAEQNGFTNATSYEILKESRSSLVS